MFLKLVAFFLIFIIIFVDIIVNLFTAEVLKDFDEKQFSINAEREKYYKDVAAEIEVEPTGSGKKKSILADLKAKKKDLAKQPIKKRIIDNNRDR